MFLEERTALTITPADAERLARELYGLSAKATTLPGEYDANFYLRVEDGREFVLKCMHPAREMGFVEMQCGALAHLAKHAPRLPLPRLQLTRSSDPIASIVDAEGQTFVQAQRRNRQRGVISGPGLLQDVAIFDTG